MSIKPIKFKYDGKDYTLRFTKRSIIALEDEGITLENLSEPSIKVIWAVFDAAFRADHPDIDRDTIDEIYDHIENKSELFSALLEMIAEQANALFDDPKKGDEKNIVWATNKK